MLEIYDGPKTKLLKNNLFPQAKKKYTVNPVVSASNVWLLLLKYIQVSFVSFQHFIVQMGKWWEITKTKPESESDCSSVFSAQKNICWLIINPPDRKISKNVLKICWFELKLLRIWLLVWISYNKLDSSCIDQRQPYFWYDFRIKTDLWYNVHDYH